MICREMMYFSDIFEVDPSEIEKYGTLNISLYSDLPLFIDPFLLYASDKEEYQALHNSIIQYLAFLRDHAEAAIRKKGLLAEWFTFPEVKQNWLGYSVSGNSGRGLNKTFAISITHAIRSIYDDNDSKKITNSTHLEELALFGEGVGRDSISDFTTNLIKQYLLRYTQEFALKHINPKYLRKKSIKKSYFNYALERWEDEVYELPFYKGDYVLLTPKDLLTKDETWMNNPDMLARFDEIRETVPNEQLRDIINRRYIELLIGVDLKNKKEINIKRKQVLKEYPILVRQYIWQREQGKEDAVKQSIARVNEVEELFINQLRQWMSEGDSYGKLQAMPCGTYQETKSRLAYFKHVMENNDGYKLCYKSGERVTQEKELQTLFKFVWYNTTASVDREVNNGRGPVDYKVSNGNDDCTLVEFKLASSSKLKQNLKNQVDVYKNANQTESAFAVIVYFDEKEHQRALGILQELQLVDNENIVLIDASEKESASNVK